MQRRQFLKKTGAGIASLVCAGAYSCQPSSNNSSNILFINIEDLSTNLGCYDKPYIKSPNIDKLASRGTIFDRAYTNQPVCAASRSSYLTGLRPETTGVDYPYSCYFVKEIAPNHYTFAQYFHEKGYKIRNFGKIHHGKDLDEEIHPCIDSNAPSYHNPENLKKLKNRDRNSQNPPFAELPPYDTADRPDDHWRDGQNTEALLRELENISENEKPFCFSIGFHKPHLPLSAPKKYWELYNREEIPLADYRQRPEGAPDIAYNRYNLKQYTWEHDNPKKQFSPGYDRLLRHAYFACVSFIDAQIGKIMDKLEDMGKLDNTIIVLIADHGFHTGELNHWGKASLFEPSLQVPMIITTPDSNNRNQRTQGLVELVDIMPTIIDLAGYEKPDYMEGTSMKPLLQNPKRKWKSAVFSRQTSDILSRKRGLSIRTKRYRYVEWKNVLTDEILELELYDLEKDPHQTKNIAHDPANSDLIERLSKQLDNGWKKALPEGIENHADNPPAPPPYAWGPEGKSRRNAWHREYGGNPDMGWRAATKLRLKKEGEIKND